jgi:hypothetical protein
LVYCGFVGAGSVAFACAAGVGSAAAGVGSVAAGVGSVAFACSVPGADDGCAFVPIFSVS